MLPSFAPLFLLAPVWVAPVPPLAAAPQEEYRWFDRGWYAGGSIGTTRGDVSADRLDDSLADQGFTTSSTIDDGDVGWKVYGGYRFEIPLSLEVGYANLGRLESEVDLTVVDIDTFLDTLADTQPFFGEGLLFAANVYPIEAKRVALGLRGGVWLWQAEIEARAATGEKATQDRDGFDPLFGGHLLLDVTDRVQLRAEYERYFLDGDGIDLFSVGIQFRFQ